MFVCLSPNSIPFCFRDSENMYTPTRVINASIATSEASGYLLVGFVFTVDVSCIWKCWVRMVNDRKWRVDAILVIA
jgi:hypothetical protein